MMDTSSPVFFEARYQQNSDPWHFATDAYELTRYETILSTISHRRYRRAFEPGCSIGILTQRLAEYCDAVLAIDFSSSAAIQAKQRCAELSNVEIRCASLLDPLPADGIDLLILSEIGYYFHSDEWQSISASLIRSMSSGGTVLAAHWLGESKDHRVSGDEVHEILLADPSLHLEYAEVHETMRLDRFIKL